MPMPGQPYQYNPELFAIADPSAVTGDYANPASLETPINGSANPYPQSADGWAKLGFMAAPAGRQAVRDYGQNVRNKAAMEALLYGLKAHQLQNANTLGDREVNARTLDNITANLVAQGVDPNVARGAAGVAMAGVGSELSSDSTATGNFQKQQNISRAQQDFAQGNYPSGNQTIAAQALKPYEVRKVSGGIAYSPDNPASADFQLTPVGQADIAAKAAAAAKSRSGIGSDKASNYEIVTDSNGNLFRVNKMTGDSTPVQGPARGKAGKSGSGPSDDQVLAGARSRWAAAKTPADKQRLLQVLVQQGYAGVARKLSPGYTPQQQEQ